LMLRLRGLGLARLHELCGRRGKRLDRPFFGYAT
jgi:hypothetical protein